jgi:hypothetical protein
MSARQVVIVCLLVIEGVAAPVPCSVSPTSLKQLQAIWRVMQSMHKQSPRAQAGMPVTADLLCMLLSLGTAEE